LAPAAAEPIPGILIQALIANTIADHVPVRSAAWQTVLAGAAAICLIVAVAALLFPRRSWWLIAAGSLFSGYANPDVRHYNDRWSSEDQRRKPARRLALGN
jgi:hypothetical protein